MDLQKAASNFEKRGYEVHVFDTASQAADYVADTVKNTTVGIGGSQTIKDMGLYERLCENNQVFWHWIEKTPEMYKGAADASVYLLSANGASENGDIVNIDGAGNRIAAACYKKDRLIYIIGENKIVPTLEDAIWRARNVAAPPNAKRLGMNTPCAVKADKCYDCNSPQRICRSMSIAMGKMMTIPRVEVILVKESLGF